MIAALALLLAAAQEPGILKLRIEGNGATTPCRVVINGEAIDPADDASLDKTFAAYPAKDWLIELSGNENVAYRCTGGVIYRIQKGGYRFTKMAFVQAPAERR